MLICFVPFLAAALAALWWPSDALAQTSCQPPGVPFSYDISGRITDESSRPLEGVTVYSSSGRILPLATTGADGGWRATISDCTLSPPRCGTGFNFRFAPVKQGYFFVPTSGEICPGSVVNFVARSAPFLSVSAASYKESLAPGAITAAFASVGSALASRTESATGLPLPESLAGTTVSITSFFGFSPNTRMARLYYVSPNQVNYYLPPETSEGPAEIAIQTANGLTLRSSVLITRIAPALFSANSSGQGVAAAVALRVKPDDSSSYEPVAAFNPAQSRFEPVPVDLGPDTDRLFLALFGTGIRNRKSLSDVTAKVGGADAQVVYAGPQNQFDGLDQVNILLPHSLSGRGEVDVVLTVEGQAANIVRIDIR